MPYIPRNERNVFQWPDTAGRLNYVVTLAVLDYLEDKEEEDGLRSYDALNTAIGALECAKQELYRRWAIPLEEDAIARNGDLDGYATEE